MKKIKITEKSGKVWEYINNGEMLERISHFGHGLPERWVDFDESIDPADILEEREVVVQEASERIPEVSNEAGEIVQVEVPAQERIVKKEVKLKAEYSVEVVDISHEWELAEVLKKRKAEYPSAEEFLNVFFDGGSAELEALKQKRLEIKAKYPKPVAGE